MGAMRRGAVNPAVVALGVGFPLVALVVVVVVSMGGGSPPVATSPPDTDVSPPAPTVDHEWNDDLAAALHPLTEVLVELATTVDQHAQEHSPDELATTLDRVGPVFASVRDSVDQLREHPADPLAKPLVLAAADLYVHAVSAHEASLAATAELAHQYDLLGRRLRILADRVFDRARERTSVAVDPGEGVRLVRPAEVPDWERLEVAAGPPLEASDPNRPGVLPLERDERRSSQPDRGWTAFVRGLDVPSTADVERASGDVDELGALARRLGAAAEALRDVPVPDGDTGRADRSALGWLLRAEAARAAQLTALRPAPDTRALAEALLALSDIPALRPG